MGFYVRPQYLETIHYYYFSIGIFSFMCAVIFGFSAVYSIMFVLLYIGQSSFAWYLSWVMQKRMRELVIPNSLRYAATHVFFTIFVGGLALGTWVVGALNEELLILILLYANYFLFFLAFVWYLITRLGVISMVFDVYDSRLMERAKMFVIKTRQSRRDVFTKILVSNDMIKNYKSGSDPDLDGMLISVWNERKNFNLLKRVAEIEMALCSRVVERMRKYINEIGAKGEITPRDREEISMYSRMIDEYGRSSMEYEKCVLSKIPE